MYFLYILKSQKASKTYVGHTKDVNRRIQEHNLGLSNFTNKFRPWIIIYKEGLKTRAEAIKREKYFKSAAGRRWIKKYIFEGK